MKLERADPPSFHSGAASARCHKDFEGIKKQGQRLKAEG
jgi:hypothetical protein